MSHIRFGVVISKSAVIPRLLRYKTTLHDPQVSSTCSDWVGSFILVRVVGLEPTRHLAEEPKSSESTNSTIPAYMSGRRNCRYFLLFGTARDQDEAQICYLCLCSILSVMLPSLLIFLVALIIEPSG